MTWFLYFISVLWIAVGSCFILYTTASRSTVKELLLKFNPKILAIPPFAIGMLLVLAASASTHPMTIRIFGAMAMIKGVFIFLNPDDLYQKSITWYQEALSDQAHRLAGIIIVIMGTAVLSWVI